MLWELDLHAAEAVLRRCYAVHSRGGKPWPPVVMVRALLLSALIGVLAINPFAAKLRQSALLRALVGITDAHLLHRTTTSPAVGAFYDFFHRLHDGPLRFNSDVDELPSCTERRAADSPRISQKAEKEMAANTAQAVSTALLNELTAQREQPRPADLLSRLHTILMAVVLHRSAQAGLLGELTALFTAGDGCVLPTAASGRGQRSCDCTARRCDCPRTYADPDARWGWDSYREQYFFGHHFYEIVVPAPAHDLPLFIDIHPGNTTDYTASLLAYESLSKAFREAGEGWRMAEAVLDAGHDALAVHHGLRDWGIRPVIPLKSTAPAHHPQRPEVRLSARGIPLCEAGVEMASRGSAAFQRPLFVCPVKAGKLAHCPSAPEDTPDWRCQPQSKYGPTRTVSTLENPRLFPEISRNSAAYAAADGRRSGCERSNSVKKVAFKLERCGHRRQSFWLIRLYTMAILQHARAWIASYDLQAFLHTFLDPVPKTT